MQKSFKDLFDAERSVRRAHDALLEQSQDKLLKMIETEVQTALSLQDEEESALRLSRLALLSADLDEPRAVDVLIDILNSEDPEVRHIAGTELEIVANTQFKNVAIGVERALKRLPAGSAALSELPYILGEVDEQGVSKLMKEFLSHADPEAVAAALESSVANELVDMAQWIEPLLKDQRVVEIADEKDDIVEVSIGELAAEAMEIFSAIEVDEDTE